MLFSQGVWAEKNTKNPTHSHIIAQLVADMQAPPLPRSKCSAQRRRVGNTAAEVLIDPAALVWHVAVEC